MHVDACFQSAQECAKHAGELRVLFPGIDSFMLTQPHSLLRAAGVQPEALCFSAKARRELAAVAPGMAPLAEQLLRELERTQQRIEQLMAADGDGTTGEKRTRLEPPESKRLRLTLEHFREQMVG